MASADNRGRIRSACDTCHRLKIKCSGHVPCGGCLNSGSSCFYGYSGRLGRQRGTKNRRPAGSEGTNTGNAQEAEKEVSCAQHSPSRPSDQLKIQTSGHLQQPSVHQIMDDFVSSDALGSFALFDSMLNEGTSGNTISFNDSPQQRGWDGRSFDFAEFPAMTDDVPDELGSSSKVIRLLSFQVKARSSPHKYLPCLHCDSARTANSYEGVQV